MGAGRLIGVRLECYSGRHRVALCFRALTPVPSPSLTPSSRSCPLLRLHFRHRLSASVSKSIFPLLSPSQSISLCLCLHLCLSHCLCLKLRVFVVSVSVFILCLRLSLFPTNVYPSLIFHSLYLSSNSLKFLACLLYSV